MKNLNIYSTVMPFHKRIPSHDHSPFLKSLRTGTRPISLSQYTAMPDTRFILKTCDEWMKTTHHHYSAPNTNNSYHNHADYSLQYIRPANQKKKKKKSDYDKVVGTNF